MNLRTLRSAIRPWPVVVLAALLTGLGFAAPRAPAAAQPPPPVPGLSATTADGPDGPTVTVESPERFALTLDASGIVAWYDLQRDPGRTTNLVAPDTRLLEHRDPDGALLAAEPQLESVSRVKARVSWRGIAANKPFELAYTIWAGGQVAIELRGDAGISTRLKLGPEGLAGAALQELTDNPGPKSRARTAMLYLDAWTVDGARPADPDTQAAGPAGTSLDSLNTVVAPANAAGQLTLSPPPGMVRQPRFSVAGWPSETLNVFRGGTLLVEGVDYLADYDPATGQLDLQYLHLLPISSDPAERSFTLVEVNAGPSVALGIRRPDGTTRTDVDENGMLLIDANLPSGTGGTPGIMTTSDTFRVPYIQKWSQLRLVATVSEPPANFSGIRFTVSRIGGGFSQTVDDTNPAGGYTADIDLPAMAEYTAQAQILTTNGLGASDQISRIGYGRIFVSVGDSITAGKWGYYLKPNNPIYPITSPPAQGNPDVPVSGDGRNYPQMDNTQDELESGQHKYENVAYAGFQIELNNRLTACTNAPVFILNDGFSGIRTARDAANFSRGVGNKNVLAKQASYRKHINDLGADYLLLMVGTNDASSNTSGEITTQTIYREDLEAVITALRSQSPTLQTFVARLPWRNDGSSSEASSRQARTRDFNREIYRIVDETLDDPRIHFGPEFYSHFFLRQNEITPTNPDTQGADKIHPNSDGLSSIARLWAEGDGPLVEYLTHGKQPRFDGLCRFFVPGWEPPTNTPTHTPTHTPTNTPTRTNTPTNTPTLRPGEPTYTPTRTATASPTKGPASQQSLLYLPALRR